jgi:hypothetical protein
MQKIKIDIVNLELLETGSNSTFNILSICLPELCGNEEIFSLNTLSDGFLNSSTD